MKDEAVQSTVKGAYIEKKKVEDNLSAHEWNFQTLFNLLPDPIVIVDGEGKFLAVNDEVEEKTGFKKEELLGKNLLKTKIVTPKSGAIMMKNLAKRIKGIHVTPYEAEVLTKDGKKLTVEIDAAKIEYEEKPAVRVMFRDITERKKAEELYRTVVKMSPHSIITVDTKGVITSCNTAATRMLGYSEDEMIGKHFSKIGVIRARDLPKYLKLFISALKGKITKPLELTFYCKNRTPLLAEVHVSLLKKDGKTIGLQAISRDITERKKIEERIRESEEKFRTLAEQSPNMIFINQKGRVVYANKRCEDVMGYKREEFYSPDFDFLTLIAPESIDLVKSNFNRHMKGKEVAPYEYALLTKEGKRIDAIITTKLIKYGGETAILGIVTDITERKRAEEALRESEEKFRNIFESASDCMIYLDRSGRILDVNRKAVEVFGRSKKELLGKHFAKIDVFYSRNIPTLMTNFANILAGKKVTLNIDIKNKKGQEISLECSASLMKINDEFAGIMVIARDVTKRKIIEERLSALNFYGRKLNTASNLQQVYELTLDAVEQTLGFEHAAFLTIDRGKLRVACQRGYLAPLHLELPLNGTKKGITVRAANSRKPVLVPDTKKDKDYVKGVPGIRSELAVPVETEDEILGVINVESRKLEAFSSKDVTLLQILASHAATAISNLKKREEIERRSSQFASLMKSSTKMISSTDLRQRLQTIAEAIRDLGWQRVVISVRDENLEIIDLVTEGLTKEEVKLLLERKSPGSVWRERFGPKYNRFKIGEFYYLPWSDPWIRENVHGVPTSIPPEKATTYSGVPSKLAPEEMIDWHPQDMLYAPLRLPEGRIVGIISMDDPLDGRRPTKGSLVPLKLFLYQAAVAIENAQLIQQLNNAKNQVKEYADQLELKVKQRTKELMEAQYKLLKAERLAAIGEVAAMVGHDLRNPLTGIAGVAYYLKMKLGSKIDNKTREMLELMEKDIEYSNKIINDLLEYSGEIRVEPTETTPKSIMREALSLVEVPKNIQISDLTRSEPKVKIDVERMKRTFVNIIKNAIDAMPKGGKLVIKSKETNGNLEIVFTDTGAGMSRDIKEKIWTPLFTTKAKGMGLGLSICKRIVEAHGGNISVESTVGKGTKFTVSIPIKQKMDGGEKVWLNVPESLLLTTTKA